MKPVITTANARNAQSFIRSATAPDTIDIAVATNTTWKKKSAEGAYVAGSSATPVAPSAMIPLRNGPQSPPPYIMP
jgi:hypothetical protein